VLAIDDDNMPFLLSDLATAIRANDQSRLPSSFSKKNKKYLVTNSLEKCTVSLRLGKPCVSLDADIC